MLNKKIPCKNKPQTLGSMYCFVMQILKYVIIILLENVSIEYDQENKNSLLSDII